MNRKIKRMMVTKIQEDQELREIHQLSKYQTIPFGLNDAPRMFTQIMKSNQRIVENKMCDLL
jgi:hypothetical protein